MTSESRTVGAIPAANVREEPRSKRRRLVDEVNSNDSDAHVQNNPENLLLENDDNKDDYHDAGDDEKTRPMSTLQSMDDPLLRTSQQLPKQRPHKDPSVTSSLSLSRRIFIGNLHPRVSKAHLEKLLQPYWSSSLSSTSKIMDIRLCFHPNGQPRGFAFCDFPTAHAAQAAIQALHGRTLLSRTLIVQEASNSHGGSTTTTTKNNNMNATSYTNNKYHNTVGRRGTRDSTVTSVTSPRREMKREELNDKIAKLKRALQENNNNP